MATTPNDLWFQPNQDPVLLPEGTFFDEGGTSWSDLANNEEGRAALGWTKAPDYPSYNAETKIPQWDREQTKWVIVNIPVPAPPPLAQVQAAELLAIDAERDRLQQLDLPYDFGDTIAINDAGDQEEAGIRTLQMKFQPDQDNWTKLHALALAAVLTGAPNTVLPMRCDDNWNVQTPATQVLAVYAAGAQRNAAYLFYGGALKSQVRAAETVEDALAPRANAEWPA